MMPSLLAAEQEPLNQVISRLSTQLSVLLERVQPESALRKESIGVLSIAVSVLPQLSKLMDTSMAVASGRVPCVYLCAPSLTAGWSTVLALVAQGLPRRTLAGPTSRGYNEGVAWAVARIEQTCPALGEDTGIEPLTCLIARVAAQLQFLLDQVPTPPDDWPGGAVFMYARFSIQGLARNMAEALYNVFGLVEPVTNPGYLPPLQWRALLEELRQPEGAPLDKEQAELHYHYREGVRWTCAKYRDTFRNLSEPARYPLRALGN
ncbi:MAG: hypothetical protein Q7S87_10145 [Agitococcus sp.]|nr:hypothetical protein [Agitococcus sp.]